MDAISAKFNQLLSLSDPKNCTTLRLVQSHPDDVPYSIVINSIHIRRFPHHRALVTHKTRSYIFKCIFSEDAGLHGSIIPAHSLDIRLSSKTSILLSASIGDEIGLSEPLEEPLTATVPFVIIGTREYLPEYARGKVASFFLDLKYVARGEYGVPVDDMIILISVIKMSPHFEYVDACTAFYFITISADGMLHIDSMASESSALRLWSALSASQNHTSSNIARMELSSAHDKIYSLLNEGTGRQAPIAEEPAKMHQSIVVPTPHTSWDDIGGQFEIKRKLLECLDFSSEDEIDAIGASRDADTSSNVSERVLSQLLLEMDGISESVDVVIIAATNRPDILDPALLRPGRFDRHILVGLPDETDRREIFKIIQSRTAFDADVTPEAFSELSAGYTGAEIVSIVQNAALLALEADKFKVDAMTLNAAFVECPPRTTKQTLDFFSRITAFGR